MAMLLNCLVLVVGFVLLVKGADFFVDGSSGVARRLRVPGVVIGLTVVAMGTSLPEASVSITAGLTGNNGLSLGNVIGSNIFNLMVVACVCALMMSFVPDKELMVRDFPVCIGASALLVFFMWDDTLQRWEGVVMLGLMAAYIALTVVQALASRTPESEEEPVSLLRCVAFILLGMAAIIWGGDLVVDSASNIAAALGLSQTLIGLTIVAVGTSLPELATSIVAARKGESGLALGNAVGSCIFNILFILGVSSALTPIESARGVLVDGIIMTVLTAALFIWCRIKGRMTKPMGAAGLLAYVAYTAYLIVNA